MADAHNFVSEHWMPFELCRLLVVMVLCCRTVGMMQKAHVHIAGRDVGCSMNSGVTRFCNISPVPHARHRVPRFKTGVQNLTARTRSCCVGASGARRASSHPFASCQTRPTAANTPAQLGAAWRRSFFARCSAALEGGGAGRACADQTRP